MKSRGAAASGRKSTGRDHHSPIVLGRLPNLTRAELIAWITARRLVDLLDTDGRVLDFKTASKCQNEISAEYSLQLTTITLRN